MAKKFTISDLKLEVNPELVDGTKNNFVLGDTMVIASPDLDEDFWQFRVKVDEDQAIVGFPKMFQIGIGFAKEENYNCNLPSTCDAKKIFNWIKDNKRYDSISDGVCIAAIRMIQNAADEWKAQEELAKKMLAVQNIPELLNPDTQNMFDLEDFSKVALVKRLGRKTKFKQAITGDIIEKTAFNIYFHKLETIHITRRKKVDKYKFYIELYADNRKEALEKAYFRMQRAALNGAIPDRNCQLGTGNYCIHDYEQEVKSQVSEHVGF